MSPYTTQVSALPLLKASHLQSARSEEGCLLRECHQNYIPSLSPCSPPPPPSSVASCFFFCLGGGGGGKTPKCTDRRKKITQKHIYFQVTKYLWHLYNQCTSPLLLMGWRYKRQYTGKTLIFKKIYVYASELKNVSHFHILKLLFFL